MGQKARVRPGTLWTILHCSQSLHSWKGAPSGINIKTLCKWNNANQCSSDDNTVSGGIVQPNKIRTTHGKHACSVCDFPKPMSTNHKQQPAARTSISINNSNNNSSNRNSNGSNKNSNKINENKETNNKSTSTIWCLVLVEIPINRRQRQRSNQKLTQTPNPNP